MGKRVCALYSANHDHLLGPFSFYLLVCRSKDEFYLGWAVRSAVMRWINHDKASISDFSSLFFLRVPPRAHAYQVIAARYPRGANAKAAYAVAWWLLSPQSNEQSLKKFETLELEGIAVAAASHDPSQITASVFQSTKTYISGSSSALPVWFRPS